MEEHYNPNLYEYPIGSRITVEYDGRQFTGTVDASSNEWDYGLSIVPDIELEHSNFKNNGLHFTEDDEIRSRAKPKVNLPEELFTI